MRSPLSWFYLRFHVLRFCFSPNHNVAIEKVSPLYRRNLPGGWFIFEDPLHGGVRRS